MHFPDDDAPKGQVSVATLRRIYPFFKGHGKKVLLSFFFVILSTFITTSLPRLFRYLIDDTIPLGEFKPILMIGLGYFGLLFAKGILEFVQSIVVGFMGLEIVNSIKTRIFEHILGLSMSFFDKNPPGKLISRIESDSQRLFMMFSSVGLQVLWGILILTASMVIMAREDIRLMFVVLFLLPLYLGGSFIVFRILRPMFRRERELYARITGFLGEHLKAITVLRNMSNLDWSRKTFYSTIRIRQATKLKFMHFPSQYGHYFLLPRMLP